MIDLTQVWDESKKTFKKKKIDIDGQVVNENHRVISRDKKRIEGMQDRYKNWKKHSSMNFLKVGDKEVSSNTDKAKSSFRNRMAQKNVADSIKRKKDHSTKVKANKFGKKEGFMQGRKVRDEIKSFGQIAKERAKKTLMNSSSKGGKGFKGGRGGNGGSDRRGGSEKRGGSDRRGGGDKRGGGKKLR